VATKTRQNLSPDQRREMLEMLEVLTPAERATLSDPDFITEDEADLIVADRRMKQEGDKAVPLDTVLKHLGITPRHRKSA
jgi:hypothetical protein